MPLMPAIRPVSSISKTEERPIRPPPTAADIGVKSAMRLFPLLQEFGRPLIGAFVQSLLNPDLLLCAHFQTYPHHINFPFDLGQNEKLRLQ
jgi:hypothetical protein